MTDEIVGKIIDGSALIISTLISVSGIWLIARHRKNVVKLAINVEGYYKLVNVLLTEKMVNDGNENPNEHQIQKLKGRTRVRVLGENSETLMSANEAIRLRKKYFG
jgi:hypothetical protein